MPLGVVTLPEPRYCTLALTWPLAPSPFSSKLSTTYEGSRRLRPEPTISTSVIAGSCFDTLMSSGLNLCFHAVAATNTVTTTCPKASSKLRPISSEQTRSSAALSVSCVVT